MHDSWVGNSFGEGFNGPLLAVTDVSRATGPERRRHSCHQDAGLLIMFAVFAAFVTVDNPIIEPLAFSLAVGVLLDAFLVRLTVVPATMAIIGNRMSYHPRWFGRYVPALDIEGATLDQNFTGASRTAPHRTYRG
ncbi:MMPL family transporter [Nocardia fusca]|uniref:MMPL family transporter n=1 Tax=Nocardia fusca TaxID=941183 RepID=UPI0037CA7756